MNKTNLILIGLILFLNSCKETDKKNDRTQFELKNNVKSLVEKTYIPIEKFGEIIKEDDSALSMYKVVYNEDGNKIEESSFYYVAKYEYFDNSKLSKTRMYESDGTLNTVLVYNYNGDTVTIENCYVEKNKYSGKRIWKYDRKGNLIELENYSSKNILKGKSIYKYDINDNQTEFSNYDADGNLTYKSNTDTYDENKNIIESISYDENSSILSKTNTKYKYDNKGNILESNSYNNEGSLEEKIVFKYDNEGNMIEFTNDNETTKYIYDKKGNWIKCITFIDNLPEKLIEREIEYY